MVLYNYRQCPVSTGYCSTYSYLLGFYSTVCRSSFLIGWSSTVTGFFYFFGFFLWANGSFLIIFSSVAPHKGQPAAKCHPRWQPTRRLAVSCGLGRHQIRTQDCRTTVRPGTIESPCLPKSHHASHESPCLPRFWCSLMDDVLQLQASVLLSLPAVLFLLTGVL